MKILSVMLVTLFLASCAYSPLLRDGGGLFDNKSQDFKGVITIIEPDGNKKTIKVGK